RLQEAHELPPHQAQAAISAIEAEFENQSRWQWIQHPVSDLILPSVKHYHLAILRGSAGDRCTASLLACQRYQLRHGRWPSQLAAAAPDLPPAVHAGRCDGPPPRSALRPREVVVWRVGRDGKTAGGTATEESSLPEPDLLVSIKPIDGTAP